MRFTDMIKKLSKEKGISLSSEKWIKTFDNLSPTQLTAKLCRLAEVLGTNAWALQDAIWRDKGVVTIPLVDKARRNEMLLLIARQWRFLSEEDMDDLEEIFRAKGLGEITFSGENIERRKRRQLDGLLNDLRVIEAELKTPDKDRRKRLELMRKSYAESIFILEQQISKNPMPHSVFRRK